MKHMHWVDGTLQHHHIVTSAQFYFHAMPTMTCAWILNRQWKSEPEWEIKTIFNQSNLIACMSAKMQRTILFWNHLAFWIWHVTFIYCIIVFFFFIHFVLAVSANTSKWYLCRSTYIHECMHNFICKCWIEKNDFNKKATAISRQWIWITFLP